MCIFGIVKKYSVIHFIYFIQFIYFKFKQSKLGFRLRLLGCECLNTQFLVGLETVWIGFIRRY